MTLNQKDIADFKISMACDLEKRIKMGYKSQFRNIVIRITSVPKRYKKIKTVASVPEDAQKLEDISNNIFSYLQDMFNVFGDNAILNAKRIFEENGGKWGRKFYKSFNKSYNASDVKKLVKELYLSFKDIDYITNVNRQTCWIVKKSVDNGTANDQSSRYFNTLYELKSIWLQHFIKAMAPGHVCILETSEENENHITTNIILKEGV